MWHFYKLYSHQIATVQASTPGHRRAHFLSLTRNFIITALLILTLSVIFTASSQSSVSAAASNKASCEAQGGTWNVNPTGATPPSCSGGTLALGMTLDQQVQSFVYYRTLGKCLVGGGPNLKNGGGFDGGERITRSNADSGQWFGQNQATGVYLGGSNGIQTKVDTNGATECAQTSLVNGALSLWDSWKPDEALCAMGMRSADDNEFKANRCTKAQGGSDEFKRGDNMASSFQKAVSNRVYGGKEPTLTANASWADAGKYLLYLKSFTAVCVPTAAISPNKPSGTTDKDYSLRVASKSGEQVSINTLYYTSINNRTPDSGVGLYSGPDFDQYGRSDSGASCAELAKAINGDDGKENGLADAYKRYLQITNVVDTSKPTGDKDCSQDGSCAETQATCGNTVEGIGWFACPLLSGIATLNDGMWKFVEGLLTVSPLQREDKDGKVTLAYQVWQVFQSISNIVLIIVFLVMIFSQLSSAGISNYGVKKLLPRLVVAAIMINVSFLVMQIAVDIANIAGTGIYNLINNIIKEATIPSWESFVGALATLGAAGGLAAGAIAIAPMAALMLALPLALGALLGFLAAVLTLMFRQAVIPILAVVAPLAFVAYLLPNTKTWFNKWKSLFVSMLMLFPIAAILFAGVKMSAYIINSGGEWWMTLTALVVMGAPLFMLPFLARQAGPMLGKLQSGIRSKMGGLEKPVRGWADGNRKASMARSDATNAGWWNIGKRARQATIRGSRKRELKAAAWKEEGNAAFNQNIIENSESLSRGLPADGAGAAYIRAVAARAQSEEVKLSMDSMKLEAGFNPNDRAALARTLADAIKSGETTRATAATNYLVAARGVDELHSTLKGAQASGYINDGPNATDSQRAMATAMQRAMTSSENGGVIKERRVDLTTWGAKGGSIQNIETNPSTWRVSAEDAAGLSSGALKAAMDAGPNGLSPEIAQRVLDTPQLRAKLDPTKENFMLSIAGRVAPRKVGPIGSEGTPSQS